ncbi:MAG: endonuclease domain-containing protein [Candidatus Falkowbacteria bacterium]|nr:endonuclease domain-containing protein [Candidatus Falkowbacteria bacterium]
MKVNKILFVRELRKLQTPSENSLWQLLRNRKLLNLKFHRQYIVVGFIIDFYCPALKLGIEVDGGIHKLKDSIIYDKERESIIKQYNISILRFSNKSIENNLSGVINQIKARTKKIQQNKYQ